MAEGVSAKNLVLLTFLATRPCFHKRSGHHGHLVVHSGNRELMKELMNGPCSTEGLGNPSCQKAGHALRRQWALSPSRQAERQVMGVCLAAGQTPRDRARLLPYRLASSGTTQSGRG